MSDFSTTTGATPRLLTLGDAALTMEFGNRIERSTHQRIMGYCQLLEKAHKSGALPGVIEWVPSFCAVTVYFDPLRWRSADLGKQLVALAEDIQAVEVVGARWRIPVLFGGDYGPDLDDVAQHCKLNADKVVQRITSTVFRVYLLGFMPGFTYMGGLPDSLATPRLSSPRTQVPARSFGIAGNLCGIYPFQSPGGWRLLGRSPISVFSAADVERPSLFAPGDEVVFQAIGKEAFIELERNDVASPLTRRKFQVAPSEPWPH